MYCLADQCTAVSDYTTLDDSCCCYCCCCQHTHKTPGSDLPGEGGWGFNPPNDFFDPRVSVDLSSWGGSILMIFPSATADLDPLACRRPPNVFFTNRTLHAVRYKLHHSLTHCVRTGSYLHVCLSVSLLDSYSSTFTGPSLRV